MKCPQEGFTNFIKEEPPPLELNFHDFHTKNIIKVQSICEPLLFTECDKINFSRFCGRSKKICRPVFFVKNGVKMGKNCTKKALKSHNFGFKAFLLYHYAIQYRFISVLISYGTIETRIKFLYINFHEFSNFLLKSHFSQLIDLTYIQILPAVYSKTVVLNASM